MEFILNDSELYELFEREIQRVGSQQALAERMNVTPAYISDLHCGKRNIGCPAVLEYFEAQIVYMVKDGD